MSETVTHLAAHRAKIVVNATRVHELLGLHPELRIDGMVSSPGSDEVSIFVTSPHLPAWKAGRTAPQIQLDDPFAGSTVGGHQR